LINCTRQFLKIVSTLLQWLTFGDDIDSLPLRIIMTSLKRLILRSCSNKP